MRFASLFSLAVLPTVLAAPFRNETRGCATHVSAEEIATLEAQFALDFAASGRADSVSTLRASIPVVWHVIYSTTTITGGYISDAAIESSISVMNEHFSGTGFSFSLVETTRTNNANWFRNANYGTPEQTDMKETLYSGDVQTLNVYSVGFADGTLGYATFPSSYSGNPKDDGVVILYSSVPGGSTTNYNEGKTLTHEVGHWLGLYHVFQGGCSGDGDFVEDTPPQRVATGGCPKTQDSCSGGGVDSIHNYMDYSYDPCMTEFTPGQAARAQAQTSTYRGF